MDFLRYSFHSSGKLTPTPREATFAGSGDEAVGIFGACPALAAAGGRTHTCRSVERCHRSAVALLPPAQPPASSRGQADRAPAAVALSCLITCLVGLGRREVERSLQMCSEALALMITKAGMSPGQPAETQKGRGRKPVV